jgi:hypothetical protein
VRLACSHTPPASAGQFPTDEGIGDILDLIILLGYI